MERGIARQRTRESIIASDDRTYSEHFCPLTVRVGRHANPYALDQEQNGTDNRSNPDHGTLGVVRSGHPLVSSAMIDIKAFLSNQRGYKLSLRQDGFRDSGLIPADFLPKNFHHL
jgi:hypothetical protein